MNILNKICDNLKKISINFNIKNKKLRFFILCLIVVIIILFYSFLKFERKENTDEASYVMTSIDEDYNLYVESKINSLLLKMDSVNTVTSFVLTESSIINNYLYDVETDSSNSDSSSQSTEKKEVVYQKSGSNNNPILVSRTYPKITAVLIYINKIDVITKTNIQNAIAGVLNIDTCCIYILQER